MRKCTVKYNTVAIGGTFDRLHKGHKRFIQSAFLIGSRVLIGLTTDRYVREKLKSKVKNYRMRYKELVEFLKKENLLQRSTIIPIDDVYGPAASARELEALIVTRETEKGGRLINKKRRQNGLAPLDLIHIPFVLAEDHMRISSTRIRMGEIDRWGKVLRCRLSVVGGPISEVLRQKLKRPLGKVYPSLPHPTSLLQGEGSMLITVGDGVTKSCLDVCITPDISIVDFHIRRKKVFSTLTDLGFPEILHPSTSSRSAGFRSGLAQDDRQIVIVVKNPAGFVKKTMVRAVQRSIKRCLQDGKKRIVRVIGEEDLAGLPAILLAPLGSVVLYGQPYEGVVVVEVTEKKKREVLDIISSK